MNVEEMMRKGISEGLKEKFRNENLDRRRTSYNFEETIIIIIQGLVTISVCQQRI